MIDLEFNKIYNDDCLKFTERLTDRFIDVVLTSPPYNNSRANDKQSKTSNFKNHDHMFYDVYVEFESDDDYINMITTLINNLDKSLKSNGIILMNLNPNNVNPNAMYLLLSKIITNTNFMVADYIVWKKNNCIVKNLGNKLSLITELVFVICRKNEFNTYFTNKRIISIRKTGQRMFEGVYNFICAPNNDGTNKLNRATYSTELCRKLLQIYAPKGGVVYDPFMGTGTTANACKELGLRYIGTEISKDQCAYAENRLKTYTDEW